MLASLTVIALLILTSTVSAIGLDLSSSLTDNASDDLAPAQEPEISVEADSSSDDLVSNEESETSVSTTPSSQPPQFETEAENQPPIAIFTYTPVSPFIFPTVNQKIIFDATASYDPDGRIVNYDWYWADPNYMGAWYPLEDEDGNFLEGPVIEYSFTDVYPHKGSGMYVVILAVVDDDGGNDDEISYDYQTIEVLENHPPIAICDVRPDRVKVNQTFVLDGTASYDPDGSIKAYYWWFMPVNLPGGWWDIGHGGSKNWSVTNFAFTREIMERVKDATENKTYEYEYIIILCVVDNEDESHVWTSYCNHSVNVTDGKSSITSEMTEDIESQSTQQLEIEEATQQTSSQSENSSNEPIALIARSTQYGWFNTVMRQIQNRILTN